MKLVAFVLSLFGPGGGHVLVGRGRRGVVFLALAIAVAVAGVLFAPILTPLLYVIVFVAAVDAARVTPKDVKPEWPAWLAFAAALWGAVIGLRLFVIEAFKIPASSMAPALLIGDHIFIGKLDREVRRGDIIVFVYPPDPAKDFVKRAVAIAGDHVTVHGDVLSVNGVAVTGSDARACDYDDFDEASERWSRRSAECVTETLDGRRYTVMREPGRMARDFPAQGEYVVPPGTVFTLGDNRNNSHDSRYWGPVPVENVKGKVWKIWWSSAPREIRWDRVGQRVR